MARFFFLSYWWRAEEAKGKEKGWNRNTVDTLHNLILPESSPDLPDVCPGAPCGLRVLDSTVSMGCAVPRTGIHSYQPLLEFYYILIKSLQPLLQNPSFESRIFFFFFFHARGRKKSILCSKSEEIWGALFKCFPLFLWSPHLHTMIMGPKILKNILRLPPKGENGTFTLVFLHLMAFPEMPCPPWAINWDITQQLSWRISPKKATYEVTNHIGG